MLAKDVMTKQVISVGPDTPVGAVAQTMIDNRISAVPVLTAEGALLGIVSEGDLLHRTETGTERERSWWLSVISDPVGQARDFVKSHGRKASDVMTSDVVTVGEETSLRDIAGILEERRIKRVPVVREDRLVGIVSRANLLQGLAVKRDNIGNDVTVDDTRIRAQLLL